MNFDIEINIFFITTLLIITVQIRKLVILMVSTNASVKIQTNVFILIVELGLEASLLSCMGGLSRRCGERFWISGFGCGSSLS
jgi:predicted KAP-like P-loop ATPase